MRTLSLFPALCLALAAETAKSADLSAKTSLSETFEGNSNYFLGPNQKAPTYLSTSSLSLDVLARTPTTSYDFKSAFNYFNYFGPGAADAPFLSGTGNTAMLTVEHKADPTNILYLTGGWSRADVAQTRLTETGTSAGRGDINIYTTETGLQTQLSNTDSFRLSVRGAEVDFSAPGSAPFFDAQATGIFSHRLGPVSNLISTLQYERQIFEGTTQFQNNFWQATTGLQTMLLKPLSFSGTVGVAVTDLSQKNVDQFLNTTVPASISSGLPAPISSSLPASLSSGPTAGLLWNAALKYTMQTTDISLISAQFEGPNTLGTFAKSTNIGLTAHHTVNHSSDFILSGNFSHITLDSFTYDFYAAGAAYNYKLTRDWRIRLDYEFRQRSGAALLGPASSNAVRLTFWRDVTILP